MALRTPESNRSWLQSVFGAYIAFVRLRAPPAMCITLPAMRESRMSIDIYYFSGTGNSLHVARAMTARIPGSRLFPIARFLRAESIETAAATVGFVFPNFCLTIPIPVKEFLERADLRSARYVFAVCTRGGSLSEAPAYIRPLLKRQGKRLNAYVNVNMPWNHPLGKEDLTARATSQEVARLDRRMQQKLDIFCRAVIAGEDYAEKDTEITLPLPAWGIALKSLLPKPVNYGLHCHMYQRLIRFDADTKCTGCGTCAAVCASGRVRLTDGKPEWRDNIPCYGCFACINYCPRKAIQIASRFPVKSYTTVNERYHHPSVSAEDMAKQR